MLHLPDITLLSISGTDDTTMFLEHFRSLCYSKQKIKFGKIKILSPIKPIDFLNDIEYVKINNNILNYYSIDFWLNDVLFFNNK